MAEQQLQYRTKPMAECKLQSSRLGQQCSEASLDSPPPAGFRSHGDLYLSVQASPTCLYSTIPG